MDRENLIKKWLDDDLNASEKEAFEALPDAKFLQDIVDNAQDFGADGQSRMPDFDAFKKRRDASNNNVRTLHWSRPLLRIASIVVVLFGLYYLFLYDSSTITVTEMAEKTEVVLPDNSMVSVNADSEIAFNEKEWNSAREVILEGEAFFDVEKGERFNVKTSMGTVSVLGTEFNVKQRGEFFEVTCYEGTVRVESGTAVNTLKVGDKVRLQQGSLVQQKHQQSRPQWLLNKSYFEREALYQVLAEIERQFDVKIETGTIETNQLFTGTFDHTDLNGALNAVTTPLNIDYQILKKDVVRLTTRE